MAPRGGRMAPRGFKARGGRLKGGKGIPGKPTGGIGIGGAPGMRWKGRNGPGTGDDMAEGKGAG